MTPEQRTLVTTLRHRLGAARLEELAIAVGRPRDEVRYLTGRDPQVAWHQLQQSERAAWLERLSLDGVARAFHEAYERLAPSFGYETRPESAVAWEDVPEQQRSLMRATVKDLLDRNVIG